MIRGVKPYPAYKDSDLDWLGRVPSHWNIRPLKRLCTKSALYGANVPATSYTQVGVRFLRTTDISEDGNLKRGGVFVPQHLVRNYTLTDGDLLISRSGTVGRSFLYNARAHGPCAYAGYLVRFVPDHLILPEFAYLFTRTLAFTGFLRAAAISSTIENVNGDKYANAPFPLPPLTEQRAIVRFLEHVVLRIRRYTRARRRLIALLNEHKRVIIQRVLTNGLDANVPLKPSGLNWLGDIPNRWRISRLKFEASHIVDCLHATPLYSLDGEFPAIRTADIEPGRLRLSQAKKVSADQFSLFTSRLVPKAGDILYSREGERLGMAALVPPDIQLCISQRMMLIRIKAVHNPEFIMWQLNCPHIYAQASADIIGATSPHVNVERVRNYAILIPPRPEQNAIVEHIRTQTENVNRTLAATELELQFIREVWTRLITDVVIGNIDVREAAAQLTDVPAESDRLEETNLVPEAEDLEQEAEELEA